MLCKKCNAQLAEDSLFCEHCGAKVEETEILQKGTNTESVICVKCGKEIDKDSTFCTYCGATVESQNVLSQENFAGDFLEEKTNSKGQDGLNNPPMNNVGMQGNDYTNQSMNNVGMQGNAYTNPPMNNVGMPGNGYGNPSMNAGMLGNDLNYQAMSVKGKKRWVKFGIVLLFVLTFFSLFLPAVKFEVTQDVLLWEYTSETETYTAFDMMNESMDSEHQKYYSDVIAAATINFICFLVFIVSIIVVIFDIFEIPLINAIVYVLSYLYMLVCYEDIAQVTCEMSVGAYVPILLPIVIVVLTIYGFTLRKKEKYIAAYMRTNQNGKISNIARM